MKTLKFFIYILMFAGILSGFSACDKDDDDGKPGEEIEGSWKEEGNKLIYKQSYNYGHGVSYSAVWTLTFDGDKCIASECKCTFGSSELADAFYEGWDDIDCPASKSGKTVTIDWTTIHKGLSKAELKKDIELMDGWK